MSVINPMLAIFTFPVVIINLLSSATLTFLKGLTTYANSGLIQNQLPGTPERSELPRLSIDALPEIDFEAHAAKMKEMEQRFEHFFDEK